MKNKLLLTIFLLISWVGAQAHSGGVWIANDGCGNWFAIVFHYHNNSSAGALSGTAKAGLYIDYGQDGKFNVNGVEYEYTNAAGFNSSDGDFQRFTDWINLSDKNMTANAFANDATTQTEVLNWLNSNKDYGKDYSLTIAIDAGNYSSTWYEALVAPIKPLSPGVYKSSTSTSSIVETPVGYSNPFDLNYTPTNFIGTVTTQSTCGETLQIDASLTQTCVEEYGLVYSLTNELPAVGEVGVTKEAIWNGNATDFENEAFEFTAAVEPANEFRDHYVRTYYLQNVSGTYFYVYSPLISAMPLDPDLDCDGDGIPNGQELDTDDPNKDTDGDGIPDYRDEDSNNDGVTDSENTGAPDCDEDGIKDFQDLSFDPEIQSQPTNSTICELNNTSFALTATGGALSYQWQVDEGSGFTDLNNNDLYNNVTSNTLDISGADNSMDGFQFRCVINSSSCNTSSTSEIATLTINVVAPPIASNANYNLGETAQALSTHITGQNLTYYDAETGGSGVVHEITPATSEVGVTEYWVSQTVDGCESQRTKLTVSIEFPYEIDGSGNSKSILFAINSKVDESVSISGSNDITNPKVYITQGYQSGDKLIVGIELPAGITTSFDANSGSLNFTGTASASVWQELFRNVMFSSTSTQKNDRKVAFILENSISLVVNGKNHYYQYITGSKTWEQAKSAAESMTFLGLQGYLATVTSQEENDFIENKLASDGWIGGSDDYIYINAATGSSIYADQNSAEDKWYWVTGPEKGQPISTGNSTPVAVGGNYMNWSPGEPNNASGEHYMQLYSSNNGTWNDLPGTFPLNGFVVEYGGEENVPLPNIQHTRIITFNEEADLTLSVNNIDENKAAGTVIDSLKLEGIDDDTSLTYSLISGEGDTDNSLFTIVDGELVTSSSFDYESNSSLSIRVKATDEYGATYEKVLNINVNNLNDNDPVITADQSFNIDENSVQNTVVGSVEVSDEDGTTTYENWTITAGNTNDAFQIDANNGEISVKTTDLDFEETASYTLTISVEDGTNTSSEVDLTIEINNQNDNAPVITADQSFKIDENSGQNSVVGTVEVSDADGATTYENWTITAGNTNETFQIDATTGEISVQTTDLDFEAIASYTLTVTVEDGVNTSSEVDLVININNLNDNVPVIASNQSFNIDENSAQNSVVGTVAVSDADGTTTYENWTITAGNTNEAFQIDAFSGEISVKTTDLDFEATATYTLTVTVEDGAHTSSEVDFVIDINNLNDIAPVITEEQSFNIDENSAQNTVVGSVEVSDADGATTYENWTITAGNTNKAFQIDANTGEISVKTTDLNYEETASYTLTVTVEDGANTSSEVDLVIDINNLNDNAPLITADQSFNIDENSDQNTVVGSVEVSDADGTTTYENWMITSGNTNDAFQIDANTGEISVKTIDLDYEKTASYILTLTVGDGINTSSEVDLIIDINNLNDNIPIITINQNFNIEENSENSSVVGNVLVTDADGTINFTWHINNEVGEEAFSIGLNDGVISVSNSALLDAERKTQFTVEIIVSDGVHQFSADVNINVLNINDNKPVITEDQSFTIEENLAKDTYIGQLIATDADAGTVLSNWEILSGNTDDAFKIDANTGALSVNNQSALDFETEEGFSLEVSVSDGDLVSELATVTIHLTDLNDVTPLIAKNMSFTILENSVNGTEVGEVTASDLDGNTELGNWKIISGNTQTAFSIDTNTGIIEVNNSDALDYEHMKEFNLEVTVSDGINTSEAREVKIILENVNDNLPTLLSLSNKTLSENDGIGTEVGYFTTADEDVIDHFTYELVNGEGDKDNGYFQIIDDELVTTKALDYDYNSTMKIRVRTADSGENTLETNFIITVNANMELELSIPTAFTPNGDGSNDTWEIDRMANYSNCIIRIFNTDGIEVFQNVGYTQQWDGYYKGKLMAIGNYYYIIQLNDNSGKVYKGSVMIIK